MQVVILLFGGLITFTRGNSQKIISECVLVYELSVIDAKADTSMVKSMSGTTKTVYIKGAKVRVDLQSPSFLQSSYKNGKSDTTIILRTLGKAKYMTFLNSAKLESQNSRYEGIVFKETGESKKILGYDCSKVEATLKDGSSYFVYYTDAILPLNREYEYQFRALPGIVLEYETFSFNGRAKVNYAAVKINLNPVQSAVFDVPKTGYRVLSY